MKVSLNLAQYYSNVDLKKIPNETMLHKIATQLAGFDEVIEYTPKYKDINVVKIVSVTDHPDADRLHVCMVDDGGKAKSVKRDSKGLVQVVCGAPNVRPGIFVAWIQPGAVVPTTYGTDDPFVLEARELRGVTSSGMLASAKELGISDDHEGILEIDPVQVWRTPKPGEPLTNFFGLDDLIIDCENKMFTHRPDCFGNLGVARELAGINGLAFKSPSWYLNQPVFETANSVKLNVKNEAGNLVSRLMSVAMKNVKVGKSPVWLQGALTRAGIKTINNVVDITNFIAYLTGQPLHAYDAAKLGSNLHSRMAKKGEKVALLNGKAIELTDADIVMANDTMPVGLAGIMGGSETEVDDNTADIIIECATFDMYTIRRSSMRHGLFTDASTRYTKGQSPLQNDRVLWYAMDQLKQLAGAEQSSPVYDVHGKIEEPADVTVTAQFINERLGSNLNLKEITKLLENVEFVIKSVPADKNRLHIRPPFWRTDIQIPEDIVEEVGRLYGYDKVPVVLPSRTTKPTERNTKLDMNNRLRTLLSRAGANEVLGYSFVHGDLLTKVGQNPELAFHLRNALSPGLQFYRLSLLPSLLEKVQPNIRADYIRSDDNDFAIYEIGKAHIKGDMTDEKVPKEYEMLAFVFTADDKTADRKYEGSPYYQARLYLETILPAEVTFHEVDHDPRENISKQMLAPFEPKRTAFVKRGDKLIGFVGEIRNEVKRALKLPAYTAGFEIELSELANSGSKPYQPISTFPKTQQDITLEVSAATAFREVANVVGQQLEAAVDELGYTYTLWPRDIYQAEGSDKKRITFRMWLSHAHKTLKTEEVNRLLDGIAAKAKENLGAERI